MENKKTSQLAEKTPAFNGDELLNAKQDPESLDAIAKKRVWEKGTGLYSAAQYGGVNIASGANSLAEGGSNTASGANSHAEGQSTTSSGFTSHSEGFTCIASGDGSHVEGWSALATGFASHAEGSAKATGSTAHAEGENTVASGDKSHSEGSFSVARGDTAHAEGDGSLGMGNKSHAEGYQTLSAGAYAHAEGREAFAYGDGAHAEGIFSQANGRQSHAEGNRSLAGNPSRPFSIEPHGTTVTIYGMDVTSEFPNAHPLIIFVDPTIAIFNRGVNSVPVFADGNTTFEINTPINEESTGGFIVNPFPGEDSHAEGNFTIATSHASHAQGIYTKASGEASHSGGFGVDGYYVEASGRTAFNHSESSTNFASNSQAANSAILGGVNNNITTSAIRSVVLGGVGRTEIVADYVNVPQLRVSTVNEYADNAAAITAGLTNGAIYRTGELLKVVY